MASPRRAGAHARRRISQIRRDWFRAARSAVAGLDGEVLTSQELALLRRHDWVHVNHVMIENFDVDHVVFGPGGCFAIETKYRSDWGHAQTELPAIADAAQYHARRVEPRLLPHRARCTPIVVVWGPRVQDTFPAPTMHHGVLFCSGHHLREHLRSLPATRSSADNTSAHSALVDYMRQRDIGEVESQGPIPRPLADILADYYLALVAFLGTLIAVSLTIRETGEGVGSLGLLGAMVVGACIARRRLRTNARVRRITTGTVAALLTYVGAIATAAVV